MCIYIYICVCLYTYMYIHIQLYTDSNKSRPQASSCEVAVVTDATAAVLGDWDHTNPPPTTPCLIKLCWNMLDVNTY